MPLKNINFQTTAFTGTKQRKGVGEELAGVVAATLGAVGQKAQLDRQYDAIEDARLADLEKIAVNDEMLRQQQQKDELDYNNLDYTQRLEILDNHKQRMQDITGGFKSTWGKTSSARLVGSYDPVIKKNFVGYTTKITKLNYANTISGLATNPNVTEDELNSAYNNVNSTADVTGIVIPKQKMITDYSKAVANGIVATAPDEFDKGRYDETLNMIKDPVAKALITKAIRYKEAEIASIKAKQDKEYQSETYNHIFDIYTNPIELDATEKDVVGNKEIGGTIKKAVLYTIWALRGKLKAGSGANLANMKKSVNASIDMFKRGATISPSNSPEQVSNALEKFKNGEIDNAFYNLVKATKVAYQNEPTAVVANKIDDLYNFYGKYKFTADTINSFKPGMQIPDTLNDTSKSIIKTNLNRNILTGLSSNRTEDIQLAQASINSLGKVPAILSKTLDDTVASGDTKQFVAVLGKIDQFRQDPTTKIILAKDPKLNEAVTAYNILGNANQVMSALQSLQDPNIKKGFNAQVSEISSHMRSEIPDIDAITRKQLATANAYKHFFGTSSGKDLVDDTKSALEDTVKKDNGVTIVDINGKYSPDYLQKFGDNFREVAKVIDGAELRLQVDGDGGVKVISNGMILTYAENKGDLQDIYNQLVDYKRYNDKETKGRVSKATDYLLQDMSVGLDAARDVAKSAVKEVMKSKTIMTAATMPMAQYEFGKKMFKAVAANSLPVKEAVKAMEIFNKGLDKYIKNHEEK